ncbi:MAG TPA: nuclear transport factor 2 family protein [Croceibacterium sp.]|nr:nuclear transport factor 2 family protein [Croceibacterium sp.]
MIGKSMMALGAAMALATIPAGPAGAQQPEYTATALADRAQIEDMLTRYYNNFGGGIESKVAEFYAPDGEMILGNDSRKGIEAIKGFYAAVPADAPQRKSFALNILIGNMLVNVHGDTATARLVFTETVIDKEGDAPRLLVQGREFDHLVKRDGRWLFAKRQIMGPKGVPDGWVD